MRKLNILFDGKSFSIKALILLEDEVGDIITYFHNKLCHLGIHMIQYEMERRKIYIHNITEIIKSITKNCVICFAHKLNKFLKIDITYFSKKLELEDIDKNLVNFTDHFIKFAKGYIINNKTSKIVLDKLKDFINNYGKPEIIHTDNRGEFISNEFKLYCLENNIKLIYGDFHHTQSQGDVERYNRNIIDKLSLLNWKKK